MEHSIKSNIHIKQGDGTEGFEKNKKKKSITCYSLCSHPIKTQLKIYGRFLADMLDSPLHLLPLKFPNEDKSFWRIVWNPLVEEQTIGSEIL